MLPISQSESDSWAPVSRIRPRGGNHRDVLAAWFAGAGVAAASELTGADEANVRAFIDERASGRIPFLIF